MIRFFPTLHQPRADELAHLELGERVTRYLFAENGLNEGGRLACVRNLAERAVRPIGRW